MSDDSTHDWLNRHVESTDVDDVDQARSAAEAQTELVRVEGVATHERAVRAEEVLHRRATRFDRGFIAFVVICAVFAGMIIVDRVGTDHRVNAASHRSAATTSAVITAMDAQKLSSRATVLLLTDFADLLTAPTVDAQKAVIAKISADTKSVADAQAAADAALEKAEKLQAEQGS